MKVSLSKVFGVIAAILGVCAFALMFAAPLESMPADLGGIIEVKPQPIDYQTVFFGTENVKGATAGLVGFIVLLVGGVLALINTFIGKRVKFINRLFSIICVVLLAGGAVLAICTKANFDQVNGLTELTEKVDLYRLTFAPILAAILGLAGAVFELIAAILPGEKKAKKGRK